MSGTLVFLLADPGFLVGKGQVDLYVDGEACTTLDFGETFTLDVEPGVHRVQLVHRAAIERKSAPLAVQIPEGRRVAVYGNYSRMWGNLKLSTD